MIINPLYISNYNMNIEIKRNEEEVIITLSGRLDTNTAPSLDKAINENVNG